VSESIRVGIDANAPYVSRAGIARYVEGLLSALPAVAPPNCEIFPVAWRTTNLEYAQPGRMLKTAYREFWWGKVTAPRLLRDKAVNVFHSTGSLFIRVPREVKHVISLHDLSISRHPERFRSWQISAWHRRVARLRDADSVLCSSTFTANEAMSLLKLPASHIEIVPLGCDWHSSTLAVQEQSPAFDVPPEFFLFVGSLEPGKNLQLLRTVWLRAEAEGKALPPLLIVGCRRSGVAHEGSAPKNWTYLGWQDDGVLLHLYRRARALVFPSIYEGFGLPLIEAMAVGCPVVCSPVSSLPEVAGDAALMTTLDAACYLTALREIIADPSLAKDLAARGLRNADRFTWRRCAADTMAAYEKVLVSDRPRAR
jgi:glycosyltransferase involved in cell wall biosynthesis